MNSNSLEDLVDTTFKETGASTLILQTIGISNNVHDLTELVVANRRIWEYATNFEVKMLQNSSTITAPIINGPESKRQIFIMDIYAYSIRLFLHQSMALELITKDFGNELINKMEDAANYDKFLDLTLSLSEAYNHSIPLKKNLKRKVGHFCADKDCKKKSIITSDGMHWCMDAIGERINAAIACLTECSLNKEVISNVIDARKCEKDCNGQYMNIHPVTSKRRM